MATSETNKPGIKTTEFYVSLATQIVGIATLIGVITPEQADSLNQIITQLAGIAVIIITNFGYLWMRTKAKSMEATATIEKAKAERAKAVLEIMKAKLETKGTES